MHEPGEAIRSTDATEALMQVSYEHHDHRQRKLYKEHCQHCKLRVAKKLAPCPKETTKRCKCCDHCRKECWVDARA
jgi:hypothetical protein